MSAPSADTGDRAKRTESSLLVMRLPSGRLPVVERIGQLVFRVGDKVINDTDFG